MTHLLYMLVQHYSTCQYRDNSLSCYLLVQNPPHKYIGTHLDMMLFHHLHCHKSLIHVLVVVAHHKELYVLDIMR